MPPKPDNAVAPSTDAIARDTLDGNTDKPVELTRAERLNAVHTQAARLVEELQALASGEQKDQLPLILGLISQVQEVVGFVTADADPALAPRSHCPTSKQLKEFGKLLRDKRDAAGLSRLKLARKAKLSDATIKFVETARHPPSRATLIRLIEVKELNLTWDDTPGASLPPAPITTIVTEPPLPNVALNCFVTPSFDAVRMVVDLGRVFNGSGGHVDQASAYLDHQSAAAYLSLRHQSATAAGIRDGTPLAEAARRIIAASGLVGLKVVALGPGDATLEVRLVQHLIEAQAPSVDLCLVDISQPLLATGQKHAAEILTELPQVHTWGMQCHFHDLPLYGRAVYGAEKRQQRRRVFCMLGDTLADIDNEPRFFQHALSHCSRGDMLLLDFQLSRVAVVDSAEIKKRDKQWQAGLSRAESAWLSGPIWRHCKDVAKVEFHWDLDIHCPVPGSYSLDAIAKVQMQSGAERQFSVFRFKRYTPEKLAACLSSLGWDEVVGLHFGGPEHPSSLRLFCKATDPSNI